MMKSLTSNSLLVLIFLSVSSGISCSPSRAEIVVVGHPNAPTINKEQIRQIFMDQLQEFPSGLTAMPVNHPENSPVRQHFYELISNQKRNQINAYWARLRFTGKGRPPQAMLDSEAVIEYIEEHPGGIGYLDSKDVDPRVKVLFSLGGNPK